ncbi:DUF6326 family protein [Cellulomonas biazotea]|uniref:Uncharacterized protein n=1 Tax=Cellulomonas biazotea TaxID=1709 RepID=A0A402DPZ5_9CELL|nr:DUF6326 family protein [Cellulomonas biazotea]GCE76203.1 hypothetical protein CBZ_12590 [Cellulomonas biazotea]
MTALATPPTTTGTPTPRVSPRTLVSSLWLFAVLCYLYCDVLGLFHTEDLAAILTGEINGIALTQTFLLGAALLMTIPITMVLLSRVAPHPVARWGTVVGGTIMTVVQVGSLFVGGGPTWFYLWFSVLEIGATGFLVCYAALRWRHED